MVTDENVLTQVKADHGTDSRRKWGESRGRDRGSCPSDLADLKGLSFNAAVLLAFSGIAWENSIPVCAAIYRLTP